MWSHCAPLLHLPGTRAESIRLIIECTNRAKVDNIAGQLMIDTVLDERTDLHSIAPPHRTHFLDASNFFTEANTTSAVNAAGHIGRNHRPKVFVFYRAFALVIAGQIPAITHGEILQFTFATLITNRAIERMVDQQKLHRRFLRLNGVLRTRADYHARINRRCTRR